MTAPASPARTLDNETIQAFRDALPAFDILQVNAGTKGITAPAVIDELLELTREVECGGFVGYCAVQEKAAAARARLARFLGIDPGELALTGNATVSLNVALALPWERWGTPVDVLISDHEYPTTNLVFGYLEAIGRARLIRYTLSADTQSLLAGLDAAVTARTRLVVASHVDCNTGLRADAAAVSAWARARGVVSFLDGAQAAGQFSLDLHALGCDLYVTNGHKWLFGPNGVGLLYVRAGFEDELTPGMVGMGTMDFQEPGRWSPGAHRFELTATRPAQVFAAMGAALDWYESFGPGAIEARQRALTARVKARLDTMPDRFRSIVPDAWERSSALATIQILDRAGQRVCGERIGAFCGQMLQEGLGFLRPVPEFDGLRLSMAYYNIDDDYERPWELLERLR